MVCRDLGGEAPDASSPWFCLKPYVRLRNAGRYLALPNRNTLEALSQYGH